MTADLPTEIAALRGTFDEFKVEADSLNGRMDRQSQVGRRVKILSVIASGVALIGILLGGWAIQAIRDAHADSEQVRRSACIQQNDLLRRIQDSEINGLRSVVPGELRPEQAAALEAYADTVRKELKYRECTPEGLKSYYEHPPVDPAVFPPTTTTR